jgi:hypothetical protein
MATLFRDFSDTYDRFVKQCPAHPLVDEIKSRISKGRFPNDSWMRTQIKRMNELMAPFWLRETAPKDHAAGE